MKEFPTGFKNRKLILSWVPEQSVSFILELVLNESFQAQHKSALNLRDFLRFCLPMRFNSCRFCVFCALAFPLLHHRHRSILQPCAILQFPCRDISWNVYPPLALRPTKLYPLDTCRRNSSVSEEGCRCKRHTDKSIAAKLRSMHINANRTRGRNGVDCHYVSISNIKRKNLFLGFALVPKFAL